MTENGHAVSLVEPASLRDAMSRFATGVVLLTVGGEHIHGMTANAFTSVSLEPPLVLCCIAHNAVMHEAMTSAGQFGVSIMGADQEDVARHFADKRRTLGAAQFDAVDWWPGPRSFGAAAGRCAGLAGVRGDAGAHRRRPLDLPGRRLRHHGHPAGGAAALLRQRLPHLP